MPFKVFKSVAIWMDLFERKVKSSQFMNHPEKGKEVVIPNCKKNGSGQPGKFSTVTVSSNYIMLYVLLVAGKSM